eukprot:gb/GECG01001127.1/.p1 GENE.gb/GECG01001127.1/~~gb/GECG01001127.1/.p1  ORF type:complete len:457 (+),score=41.24 gb/GECG01001127.1/:1-1371(+)
MDVEAQKDGDATPTGAFQPNDAPRQAQHETEVASSPTAAKETASFTEATLESLIKEHPIVIFGTTTCPFTTHALDILESSGVPFKSFELNKLSNGSAIRKVVEAYTKYYTVPNIFVKGDHIGGCNELVALEKSGDLDKLARERTVEGSSNEKQVPSSPRPEQRISRSGLFWFPSTVNSYAVRLIGLQTVILSLFGIIFRNESEMKWIIVGLAGDFVARLLAGPTFSLLGIIAGTLTAYFPPRFGAGPPKQFAASIGMCFSGLAAGLLLGGFETAASVVLAILMFAASLESFFDFCLGCYFFGLMIDLGLVPKSIYKYHLETLPEVKRGWQKFHVQEEGLPEIREIRASPKRGAQSSPLPIDPKIKTKRDEHKWFDVHLIRHMQVIYFIHPLTIAILALVWNMMSDRWIALRLALCNLAYPWIRLGGLILHLFACLQSKSRVVPPKSEKRLATLVQG